MKITFIVSRPLRYPAQLQDFKQSAKGWIATLIQSLGDQLNNGGDGTIGMDIDGVRFEFRVVVLPAREGIDRAPEGRARFPFGLTGFRCRNGFPPVFRNRERAEEYLRRSGRKDQCVVELHLDLS